MADGSKDRRAPRCSVVVPAYNSRDTLGRTLDALLHQTMDRDEYEVIVVDDGSTDDTRAVAQARNVRYVHQENRGPAAARNRGAREATGELLLFTDADCEPRRDWLERMAAPFADPETMGVQGAYRTRQRGMAARFAQAEFEDRYDLMARYEDIDLIATYAAAFRTRLFLEMGAFDEHFPVANNEDTDFSYRLFAAGHKMVFAPDAVVYHRHPDSLRRYLRTKYWRAFWRMVVYRRYPGKAVKDRYTTKTLKVQTLGMLLALCLLPPALFWPPAAWAAAALAAVVALSSLPFALKTLSRDALVGALAPGIVFLRSVVFALGSAHGIVHCLRCKT